MSVSLDTSLQHAVQMTKVGVKTQSHGSNKNVVAVSAFFQDKMNAITLAIDSSKFVSLNCHCIGFLFLIAFGGEKQKTHSKCHFLMLVAV